MNTHMQQSAPRDTARVSQQACDVSRAGGRRSRLIAILLLLVPFSDGLSAQQSPPELPTGTRIRLTVVTVSPRPGPTRIIGSLLSIDPSSVVLTTGDLNTRTRIPRSLIEEMAVSRGPGFCREGRRVGCVAAGLLGGTLLGATLGGLLGKLSADSAKRNDNCLNGECEYAILGGIVIGGLVGGIGGTITGATVGGERWEPVLTSRPQN